MILLAGVLGVSVGTALVIVDFIMAGMSIFAIGHVLLLGGGLLMILASIGKFTLREKVRRWGRFRTAVW